MFSGIVEETGKVIKKIIIPEGIRFKIESKKVLKKLKSSASVCVNGVCHTVIKKDKVGFEFISVHETLKKTNLGDLNLKDFVNLEGSLKLGDQLGGHFVLGHIDDTGVVDSIKQIRGNFEKDKESENWEYVIKFDSKYRKYIIHTGSIAVNGVSLTIAEIMNSGIRDKYTKIKIAIIPYTYNHTNFKYLKAKDRVNLEFDFLGKYVLNMLEGRFRKDAKI